MAQSEYQQLLEAQKKRIANFHIKEALDISEATNKTLSIVYTKMNEITKKPVYADFSYRAGKLIGVLRHIQQNPKYRSELLKVTGLSEAVIDLYNRSFGQLPYARDGKIELGRAQDCDTLKELLIYVADKLNIVLTDYDIEDITEEHYSKLFKNATDVMNKNANFNPTGAINYEE